MTDAALHSTDAVLALLTGRAPLPWQSRLARAYASGRVPDAVDLPTGLGKTDAVACFLAAHAVRALTTACGEPVGGHLPTRLAYVVDRRAVVDQAGEAARGWLGRLASSADPLAGEIRDALLARCAFAAEPVATSSWRGGVALDRGAVTDPCQVAVMTATTDMAGSRILWSGYGTGRWSRGHDAGLWGHDVLVLLDEAHLSPVLASTLAQVAAIQARDGSPRPLRYASMSATGSPGSDPMRLDAADLAHPWVARRLRGSKTLRMRQVDGKPGTAEHRKALGTALADAATGLKGRRRVVFADLPDVARDVAARLCKRDPGRVAVVTGRQRAAEREDAMAGDGVLAEFLARGDVEGDAPVYLVATSAAEVGLDAYAHDAAMDLVSAVRLVQRLGRVNRAGDVSSIIVLCHPVEPDAEGRRTLAALAAMPRVDGGLDVSVTACCQMADLFAVAPDGPPFARHDACTLSSVPDADRDGIRPSVDHWLRDPERGEPDVTVAWRAEVPHLAGQPGRVLDAWAEACPLAPREALALPRSAAWRELPDILARGACVWLGRDGTWRTTSPGEDDRNMVDTVVLDPAAGGLDEHGFLTAAAPSREGLDVGASRRTLEGDDGTETLAGPEPGRDWRPSTVALAGDPPRWIAVRVAPMAGARRATPGGDPSLDGHSADVAHLAARAAGLAGLGPNVVVDYYRAGLWHDDGKRRPRWQAMVGGSMAAPLAKSAPGHRPGMRPDGYRHEVGSLHAMTVRPIPDGDLSAHLVASHHGRMSAGHDMDAIGDRTRRREENAALLSDAVANRDRLQRRYGPWGLAWLEALFRSADRAVSAGLGQVAPSDRKGEAA